MIKDVDVNAQLKNIKGQTYSLAHEFRQFAVKGNVVDLAVGVIIGAAFGKIVSSLVADIIMPPIGLIAGGVNLSHMVFQLKEPVGTLPAIELKYGQFLQTILDFTIVAFSVFMMVKGITRLRLNAEPPPAAPPSNQEVLLKEIRDLLAAKK